MRQQVLPVHVGGGALQDAFALIDNEILVRDGFGQMEMLLDHDKGAASRLGFGDDVLHVRDIFRLNALGRLVEQRDVAFFRQGAREERIFRSPPLRVPAFWSRRFSNMGNLSK